MAVKASDTVTLVRVNDGVKGETGKAVSKAQPYYQLASSAPATPTASTPPSPWTATEPTYTPGSTLHLYRVTRTGYSDGSYTYSTVTQVSSYEAARAAYLEALASGKIATSYISSDSTGVMIANMTSGQSYAPANIQSGFNTRITPKAFEVRDGQTVLSSFGREVTLGTRRAVDASNPSTAIGEGSFTSGANQSASGIYAHAEGSDNYASGGYAHAEGYGTIASGWYGHSEGRWQIARGYCSHAEGVCDQNVMATVKVKISGAANATEYTVDSRADQLKLLDIGYQVAQAGVLFQSISYGGVTVHPQSYDHWWNDGTAYHFRVDKTLSSTALSNAEATFTYFSSGAMASYAHCEGGWTLASGMGAHAQGYYATAAGYYSFASGQGVIARGACSFVHGKFNVKPSQNEDFAGDIYAEIVGNGTSDNARSNARTLDWAGNEWLAGKLTASAGLATPGDVSGGTFNGKALHDLIKVSMFAVGKALTANKVTDVVIPYTVPSGYQAVAILEAWINAPQTFIIGRNLDSNSNKVTLSVHSNSAWSNAACRCYVLFVST